MHIGHRLGHRREERGSGQANKMECVSDKEKGCSNKKDVWGRIVRDSLCEDGTQLSSSFLHIVIVGQPSGHGERLTVQALGLTAWF